VMAWVGFVGSDARVVRMAAGAGHAEDHLSQLAISLDDVPEGGGRQA